MISYIPDASRSCWRPCFAIAGSRTSPGREQKRKTKVRKKKKEVHIHRCFFNHANIISRQKVEIYTNYIYLYYMVLMLLPPVVVGERVHLAFFYVVGEGIRKMHQ